MKGGGNLVVSNQRVNDTAQQNDSWRHVAAVMERWIGVPIKLLLDRLRVLALTNPLLIITTSESETLLQEIARERRQSSLVSEGRPLMFRRENQGESFDDDVAALRDQAGSGRRDQGEAEQFASDDQTTYSPPRQTWSPVSTSTAGDLDPEPPTMSRQPLDAGNASVIAANTSWDGQVQSSGSLHIHGNVGGQIRADGDVFVAEGASVSANVFAGSVTVAGTLEGAVECSGRFEVLPSGRVSADVAAPRLVVHEGAVVVGKLRMTSSDGQTG